VPRTTEKLPKDADPITTWLSGRRTASANLLKPEEVEGFRHAQQLGFRCAQSVVAEMRPGWTEAQAGQWMIEWLYDDDVKTMLHKPIAVFHERSQALDGQWGPVTKGTGAVLRDDDVVILDCAPIVDGYASTTTAGSTIGSRGSCPRRRSATC
jgi:Xaa-Pro aminopeptidase